MTEKYGRLLIVDDDADVLQAARIFLKQHLAVVHTEPDPGKIPQLLANDTYDVILLDMNFARDVTSGQEGFHWLKRIHELEPGAVVILITAFGDVEMAVRALKEGAADFILKPWQNEKLLATVSSALQLRRSRSEASQFRNRQELLCADLDLPYLEFIGASPQMRRVFETIGKVAATDANVLILGENGTGKELVARALHRKSRRAKEIFMSVDMGAISETLFESELFGHLKGSFTDARADRAGRFEAASGGTLFLDEIGNLPLALQSKILRTLEERQIIRLGSNKPVPIDIRLICATNLHLDDMASRKEFRLDLLYRINTVEIKIPPLRERGNDITLLAEHFLAASCRKYAKPPMRLSNAALKRLQLYQWPGNVRELQHAMERACIMSDTPVIQPEDIFTTASAKETKELNLDCFNLEDVEKMVIRRTLEKHQGNISHTAEELGITRAALYRRMEKYGL